MQIGKKIQQEDLYKSLAGLSTHEEVRAFLEDLCTPQELTALKQRFSVAKMLWDGKYYSEIIEKTGASSATVSRVKRSLSPGNGYALVFEKDPGDAQER